MKPKTIWLKEETYQRLDRLREKRESFDQVVSRLCWIFEHRKEVNHGREKHTESGTEGLL